MSRLSIICLTGPSVALFVKSCWLCHLIRSFCLPDDVPIRLRLDAIICYPALCIKWRYRDLVHTHSVHFVTLTPLKFHFVHELFPSKEHFFVVLVRYLFLNHIFFTPFAFLPTLFTEYIFGLTATTSSIKPPPHSSFIFPKAFLFLAS